MTAHNQDKNTNSEHKISEFFRKTGDFIISHSKIVYPCILIIAVAITVVVALSFTNRNQEEEIHPVSTESISDSDVATGESISASIPNVPLELNAYPEVNELILAYYTAISAGDVDAVLKISNNIDNTEQIRIVELSKYISSYPAVEIYTKPGPIENSYLAYVYTQVKFEGYESTVPGMSAFYICTREDGSLYINEGDEEQYITDYIKEITAQEDVVELYNQMTVAYNELLVNDTELGIFLQALATQIEVSVGEALAAAELEAEPEQTEGTEIAEGAEGTEGSETSEGEAEVTETNATPTSATVTTTINVRSSDSETADRLGRLETGSRVDVLEVRVNGWTKITYDGKDAFVKSDYLAFAESADDIEVIGTVTASTNVNIRASASETGEKLGVASGGEELELIEEQSDGWSKIKYKNQVAYVKSEYLE